VVERFPGIPTRAIGQKNVPGIAQSLQLEEATILEKHTVEVAVREVMESRATGVQPTAQPLPDAARAGDEKPRMAWIPPRYYLG